MLVLGIDLGTSSIKASVVETGSHKVIAAATFPETEAEIISLKAGWAEQSPDEWWRNTQQAILKLHQSKKYNPQDIRAIGIAYQMHGLVLVDKHQEVLRNSIIWCDSRAVEFGDTAMEAIGKEKCLTHLLNSPGNFTAAKLAWVKKNEPTVFERVDKIMLPGDFIAMKMTGEITTSISALSEGVFWDFANKEISKDIMDYFGYDNSIIPVIRDVFETHGQLTENAAQLLGMQKEVPVTYKAGDQPNNALSLSVLKPGEIAANAGTSGVIYGVSDQLIYDQDSRINSFAHVNNSNEHTRIGVLLCINGTGILNKWLKNISSSDSYLKMNELASKVVIGSEGLSVLPFGNGAERILKNKMIFSHILGIDFNLHTQSHLLRAGQEGIAFAFQYGIDIMRENGMNFSMIKAGKTNLFLSDVFVEAFVNTTGIPISLYKTDGSVGAAMGAAIGVGAFVNEEEAFQEMPALKVIVPEKEKMAAYQQAYQKWNQLLSHQLNS